MSNEPRGTEAQSTKDVTLLRMKGLPALTEREREIADLVSRGETNRQIAARTYLSERTVERHLSHIFGKLEVSSRAAVASAVAAAGEASPDGREGGRL